MKSLNTFFQLCVYFTICMFVFILCVHYVSGLEVFPTVETGFQEQVGVNETFQEVTSSPDYASGVNMNLIWGMIFTGAGLGSLLIAWFTHSTSVIGVFLFSIVFWASYINMLMILHIGNWIPLDFIGVVTGGIVFIFVGAIIGMLTGSG